MPTTHATQSFDFADVLDAFQGLLEKATGFPARRVVEWYGDGRPNVDANGPVVWWRWLGEDIDAESGAGRHGMRDGLTVEANVVTRVMADGNHRDRLLGRAHLATVYLVVNALAGRTLHATYLDVAGDEPPMPEPEADLLTVGTMMVVSLPKPDRPRPEQGCVETRVGIKIPCVLRVTLNDVPPIE
jgi:hypothetical protein